MEESDGIETEIRALEKSRDKIITELHEIEKAIEIRRSIQRISRLKDADADVRILVNRHLIKQPELEQKKALEIITSVEEPERRDNIVDSPISSIGSAYSDMVIVDGQTMEVPPLI